MCHNCGLAGFSQGPYIPHEPRHYTVCPGRTPLKQERRNLIIIPINQSIITVYAFYVLATPPRQIVPYDQLAPWRWQSPLSRDRAKASLPKDTYGIQVLLTAVRVWLIPLTSSETWSKQISNKFTVNDKNHFFFFFFSFFCSRVTSLKNVGARFPVQEGRWSCDLVTWPKRLKTAKASNKSQWFTADKPLSPLLLDCLLPQSYFKKMDMTLKLATT